MGHGKGYVYPHDSKDSFAVQDYMGVSKTYYFPKGAGYEAKIRESLEYWEERRKNSAKEDPAVISSEKK
jgi:putative ATPase